MSMPDNYTKLTTLHIDGGCYEDLVAILYANGYALEIGVQPVQGESFTECGKEITIYENEDRESNKPYATAKNYISPSAWTNVLGVKGVTTSPIKKMTLGEENSN